MARRLTRDDGWVFLIIGCTIVASVGLGKVASGTLTSAAVALALAFGLVTGAIAWAVFRARSASYVDLDEGGVRLRVRGKCEWIPFKGIARSHGERSLGRVVLHLDDRVIVLADGHPETLATTVAERIKAARAAPIPATHPTLARGGRSLDLWLESLRAGGGYRGAALDRDELLRTALDPAADAELRAASMFVLLEGRDTAAKARIRSALAATMPPIVLLVVSIALPRGAHTPGLETAKELLSREDVEAGERLADERPRVRVAPEESPSQAALLEAEAEAEAASVDAASQRR